MKIWKVSEKKNTTKTQTNTNKQKQQQKNPPPPQQQQKPQKPQKTKTTNQKPQTQQKNPPPWNFIFFQVDFSFPQTGAIFKPYFLSVLSKAEQNLSFIPTS